MRCIVENWNGHFLASNRHKRMEDIFVREWTSKTDKAKIFWSVEEAKDYIKTCGLDPLYDHGLLCIKPTDK